MKKRIGYLIALAALLVVEILIGTFVHDDFVRPYVGDILVTALLCCLARCIQPEGHPWLPAAVFVFALGVECMQLISIPALEGTIWAIILGSTFDWADIACYAIGCIGFAVSERMVQ